MSWSRAATRSWSGAREGTGSVGGAGCRGGLIPGMNGADPASRASAIAFSAYPWTLPRLSRGSAVKLPRPCGAGRLSTSEPVEVADAPAIRRRKLEDARLACRERRADRRSCSTAAGGSAAEIAVCPPFVYLWEVARLLKASGVAWARSRCVRKRWVRLPARSRLRC